MNMAHFPNHSVLSGLVAVLFLQLLTVISAHFTVIAHAEPLLVMVGEDAMLHCHLFPKKSAEQMEVRWFRSQFSPAVYVYKYGKERDEEQMKEYQGRTTFVRDNIKDGNVALKMHNVTVFEDGRYHCYFQEGRSYEEAFIDLKVASLGSDPFIKIIGYEYGWIQLECTSFGWYPQPWVEWRNLTEDTIPSLEEHLAPSEDGMFVVNLSVVITDHTIVSVFCSIKNPLLNQSLLTMMSIPETVWVSTSIPSESPSELPDPTTPGPEKISTWMVALVALLAIGLFIAYSICLYFIWKQHKRKKTLFIEKEIECEEKEKGYDERRQEHMGKERASNLTGWRRTQLYAADVTLDQNTAHPELYLSWDLRSVIRGDTRQDLPDNPERFDCRPCVLGHESFTSGRHYWEVEVRSLFKDFLCDPPEMMMTFPVSSQAKYLIFFFFQLPMLDSARFDVIGPVEPILAMVGEDIDLPCYLSPNISAENMELRWYRNKISPAVYVYQKEKDQEGEQIKEYRGRTTFVQDNITEGNVAVTIHNVRTSDDGQYRCFFKDDQMYEEAIIELKVASLGSDPHIHMEAYGDEGILLECTSVGWYPVPQVLWKNLKGEILPLLSLSQTPNDGLITVDASVVVRDYSMGSASCSIRNPLLNLEKVVRISIPGPFFSRLSPWMLSMAVILTALGLLTIGAIFFIWKLHRNKNGEKENKCLSKEKLQEELRWKKAQLHAVDVTLDPDTAHPHLFLYEGLKSIRLEDTRQKLPDKPERFDSWPCILGQEGFISGKHYWEVEVGDRTDWAIGVCKENVTKKGFDPMTPENGFWAVELYGNGYWALTPLRTPLPLTGPPRRIGVFLDYESGHISFYDMTNGSHIYTFPKTSFSGTLRPFFCLWSCGKKPLTICPIFDGPDEVTVIANPPVPSKETLVTPTSEKSISGDTDTPQSSNSKVFPVQPNNGALDH